MFLCCTGTQNSTLKRNNILIPQAIIISFNNKHNANLINEYAHQEFYSIFSKLHIISLKTSFVDDYNFQLIALPNRSYSHKQKLCITHTIRTPSIIFPPPKEVHHVHVTQYSELTSSRIYVLYRVRLHYTHS